LWHRPIYFVLSLDRQNENHFITPNLIILHLAFPVIARLPRRRGHRIITSHDAAQQINKRAQPVQSVISNPLRQSLGQLNLHWSAVGSTKNIKLRLKALNALFNSLAIGAREISVKMLYDNDSIAELALWISSSFS
jgi:hypothetical protein